MAYLCNNEETRQRILDYIDEYVRENLISPSIRDIAEGTGISRATVSTPQSHSRLHLPRPLPLGGVTR